MPFAKGRTWQAEAKVSTRSHTERCTRSLRIHPNYHPDSDLYIVYNVGTQFASIVPANLPQVRETRFAIKWTYSWQP